MDVFRLLCRPDAGSKRQGSQDLSQFRDKTLDARSSTIRTDSIRFSIPGDNCLSNH